MILALSPHTDDTDLGCGGMLAKYRNRYKTHVKVVAFSDCGNETTRREFMYAQSHLEVTDCYVHDFSVREFHHHRQEILEILRKLYLQYRPDFVLTPSTSDCHQDHKVVTEEAIRAFKNCSIYGYKLPWNNVTASHSNVFCKLNEEDVRKKKLALSKYATQSVRPYMDENYIEAQLLANGIMCGVKYAESFEAIRVVI